MSISELLLKAQDMRCRGGNFDELAKLEQNLAQLSSSLNGADLKTYAVAKKVLAEARWIFHARLDVQFGDLNLVSPGQNPLPPSNMKGLGGYGKIARAGFYSPGYPTSLAKAHIRLRPESIPHDVKQAIGTDKVEACLFSVELVKWLKEKSTRLNLVAHPLIFPDWNGKWDEKEVEMGLYHAQGVSQVLTDDGLAFNALKKQRVICHPGQKEGTAAFSPNNCQFDISRDAPTSSFWSVVKADGKAHVAFHVLIGDANPFTEQFVNSFDEMHSSLEDVVRHSQEAKRDLASRLDQMQQAFKAGEKDFKQFNLASIENAVYYHVWKTKWDAQNPGKPAPHYDFGKASFHGYGDLAPEYHCKSEDRANAVEECKKSLESQHSPVLSELEKAVEVVPLTDNSLFPLYREFREGNTCRAFELFNRLDQDIKGRIYGVVWEMFGKPMDFPGDFGEASFYGRRLSPERCCDDQKRALAILLHIYNAI